MVPLSHNRAQSEFMGQSTSSSSQSSEFSGMDTEQMFRLIDSILPFEACLYYQFLPLALEGRYLKLGMVSLHDPSALDYVRRILAYLNCSLKTQQISAETHQAMLSAYLNYTRTSSSNSQQAFETDDTATQSEQSEQILNNTQVPERELSEPSTDAPTSSSPEYNSDISRQYPSLEQTPEQPTSVSVAEQQEVQLAPPAPTSVTPVSQASLVAALPLLEVQALHLSRPLEFIATLAPQQMLQELLGRVLISGIGRLYFEQQAEQGRILWSQDGVLQCVLEGLALSVFKGVISELKRIGDLPLLPVKQPKQVEIERRYQQETLLLRLRVMPGTHGEEATLQVLRGAALKFYQRQQLETLGQDALKLAQQLQRKLNEICARSSRNPIPLEALPALNQQLRSLTKQIEALTQLQTEQESED
jgi:type II secretory ATPase GspE/PulE/Tfp pilus assembly ATPase PilB-like protein